MSQMQWENHRAEIEKGRVFYGCSEYPKCDFVSWDPPSKEKCPVCGKTLLQKKSKIRPCIA